MLNLRLLQETIRENKRLWLICTALLTAGMLVCEAVYGTDAGEKLWQFFFCDSGNDRRNFPE